jgi:hypothetical protein
VDHNFFAAWRLCAIKNPPRRMRLGVLPAEVGLCENKKKESTAADGIGAQSREGAKKGCFSFSFSLPVVGGPVFLCGLAPLREEKRKN